MQAILFAVGIALVSVAAAVAVGSATWLFWDAWKSSDLESFRALVGGFSCAFFAYLFVRFGDALKKIYDRKELNHTTLIKLQHYLNDCLSIANDNIFIIDDCRRTFDDGKRNTHEVPIFSNSFQKFRIDRDLIINLTNVEFMNDAYSFNVGLAKMNDSMTTVESSYAQMREALIAKNIDPPTYKENAWKYRDRCIEIQAFLKQLQNETVGLLATSRILAKEHPFFTRVIQLVVRTSYPKNFHARLAAEIKAIEVEVDAERKSGAERIREIQQRR